MRKKTFSRNFLYHEELYELPTARALGKFFRETALFHDYLFFNPGLQYLGKLSSRFSWNRKDKFVEPIYVS